MTRRSALVLLPVISVVGLLVAGCDAPPPQSKQQGYRGLGMVQVDNPRTISALREQNSIPAPQDPVQPGGPSATTEYKNLKVLTDVSVDELNRLMLAMTEWVAPEQGCGYCHNVENLAADVPNKVVARRMLEMTRHINADWKSHVADTGVTCYTCHRGKPNPANIWYNTRKALGDGAQSAILASQNAPSGTVGFTSLPNDPFAAFLDYANEIRVVGKTALPQRNTNGASIKATEATYGLMFHMSQALGVNCTFCHNTRSFASWEQSNPSRAVAWHGLRMVRELNASYLEPLKASLPPARLGPNGETPQLNCATCHAGVSKPLFGASMLKDYRELAGPRR